jgi:hypothetical protein
VLEPEQPTPPGLRRHRFMGHSIDLPEDLTEAQLDGRACIHCAAEDQPMRPVEAWSEISSQLFECVDTIACADRGRSRSHEGGSYDCHNRGVVFNSDV